VPVPAKQFARGHRGGILITWMPGELAARPRARTRNGAVALLEPEAWLAHMASGSDREGRWSASQGLSASSQVTSEAVPRPGREACASGGELMPHRLPHLGSAWNGENTCSTFRPASAASTW
jgi:hypothetical protein